MAYIVFLIDWLLKPSFILGSFLCVAYMVPGRSAASRHFLLATASICLLMLPLASYFLPSWSLKILPLDWEVLLLSTATSTKIISSLALLYIFGVCWVLFYLLMGVIGLWVTTSRALSVTREEDLELLQELRQAMNIKRPLRLLLCRDISSPQVWGLCQPVVMLPVDSSAWSLARKRFVLIHELAHVARWDWPITILVKISCALFWFLPMSWMLDKRMGQAAEMACDDFLYRLRFDIPGKDSTDYAENLLQLALLEQNPKMDAALQIVNGSPVYQRVISVLDISRQRDCLNSDKKGWALLLGTLLLLTLSGLEAAVTPLPTIDMDKYYALTSLQTAAINEPSSVALTQLPSLALLRQQRTEFSDNYQRTPVTSEMIVWAPERVTSAPSAQLLKKTSTLAPAGAMILSEPEVSIRGYLPHHIVTPRYPRKALHFGLEGDVSVTFSITAQGLVDDISIVQAQPRNVFEAEVLKAVVQFRYRPQFFQGRPVRVSGIEETFNFRLRTSAEKSALINTLFSTTQTASLTPDHR